MMTTSKPLTWIATTAIALIALTGCASGQGSPSTSPTDDASASQSAAATFQGQALDTSLEALPEGAALVDTKGNEVARDAPNYTIVSVDETDAGTTVTVTREGWESGAQLVDVFMPVEAPDSAVVQDTAGTAIDPATPDYVVLGTEMVNQPETASFTITYLVEPNREYTAGE